MAHEFLPAEYSALVNGNWGEPLTSPTSVMSWADVGAAFQNGGRAFEIHEFLRRGGRVEIGESPTVPWDHFVQQRYVEYTLNDRHLRRPLVQNITPDQFFQVAIADIRSMLRDDARMRNGPMDESWGPSPIDIPDAFWQFPPMSSEEAERMRRIYNENNPAPALPPIPEHMVNHEVTISTQWDDNPEELERIRHLVEEQMATYSRNASLGFLVPNNPNAKPNVRAKEWLLEHLTDEQRAEFETKGMITVKGQSGRIYRINTTKSQMNIQLTTEEGNNVWGGRNLCVVSKNPNIPLLDQVLMQKLMIETKEEEFLKLAGVRGGNIEGEMERNRRLHDLQQQYAQDLANLQQNYADAVRALEEETRQAGNAVDEFNFNYRNRFGVAGPMTTNGILNGLASS